MMQPPEQDMEDEMQDKQEDQEDEEDQEQVGSLSLSFSPFLRCVFFFVSASSSGPALLSPC